MSDLVQRVVAQRFRIEEEEVRRMLDLWDDSLGEPILVYGPHGDLLGIGPNCEIGEMAVITVKAVRIIFTPLVGSQTI